ncbi:MAG: 2-amino-4-hydroxy-6-hydroxymethyldihydropteridine diphosphokinase [Muribaculaceae bacterium]|nr:2-amino-4-hydroxy-6-hydroxymethyldihydropteridine diphosphokinase [Muribaculaceae bacterium]
MAFVIVNIGSNLGNRRLNLSRAVRKLGERFGAFELSHAVESDPWGFDSTHSFLNIGMAFQSEEAPLSILRSIKEIEQEISPAPHRNPDGSYADREIDIDIVAIDRDIIDTSELTIPHPRLPQRSFFLKPLQEIAPGWVHPLNGKNASEMLGELQEKEEKAGKTDSNE